MKYWHCIIYFEISISNGMSPLNKVSCMEQASWPGSNSKSYWRTNDNIRDVLCIVLSKSDVNASTVSMFWVHPWPKRDRLKGRICLSSLVDSIDFLMSVNGNRHFGGGWQQRPKSISQVSDVVSSHMPAHMMLPSWRSAWNRRSPWLLPCKRTHLHVQCDNSY